MGRTILCLNAGSSSLKFAVFEFSGLTEARIAQGAIEDLGPSGRLWIRDHQNEIIEDRQADFENLHNSIEAIFSALQKAGKPAPSAAGHRIVHGGPAYTQPVLITAEVIRNLRQSVALAPLHLPSQIELIDAITIRYPRLPQVACFDTAFHNSMPEIARRLPLPNSFWEQGIRRYGFHGLSYEFVLSALGEEGKGRIIVAHLGNGASMAAVHDGRPLDTSMGLTPTGGFMMSTRTGDLDPGVVLYLQRAGYTEEQLEDLLNHRAGLLGVSGVSSDMKALLAMHGSNASAAQAVDMFCYGIRKFIGAYAAVLGGLDSLVFTGGIGERAAPVREQICQGLEFLGIQIDAKRNQRHGPIISTEKSRCLVRVIATDEDLMIARHTSRLVANAAKS